MQIRATSLFWLIKESFIDYVDALPDGVILGDRTPRGFQFAVAEERDGTWRGSGRVDIRAHDGALRLLLEDPAVHLDGTRGSLSAAVNTPAGNRRRQIASLGPMTPTPGGGASTEEVMLTHEGSSIFDGHYGAYTRLAPLILE